MNKKLLYSSPKCEIISFETKKAIAVISATTFAGFNNDAGNEIYYW